MNDDEIVPDPEEKPLKAAYWKLHLIREDMSKYYDESNVQEWATDIEWAMTAISNQEGFERWE